jgi:hypothetical protein
MRLAILAVAALAGSLCVGCSHFNGEKKENDEGTRMEKIDAASAPAAVMSAFKKDHPSAANPTLKKETYKDGTVHYEFEWTENGKKREVEYSSDGEQLEGH